MMSIRFALLAVFALPAALPVTAAHAQTQPAVTKTEVRDRAALDRLRRNSGVGLQWFFTNQRGQLRATWQGGVLHLEGGQSHSYRGLAGTLKLNGDVVSIAADRFIFRGQILITDAPDKGRIIDRIGDFEFRITQKRKYWRMQDFTAKDGLADYVDIYF